MNGRKKNTNIWIKGKIMREEIRIEKRERESLCVHLYMNCIKIFEHDITSSV